MKTATLIFPHQLFEHHPALEKKRPVYLIEHSRFFTDFSFHKQKLVLHRASMQFYYHFLKKKGYSITYIDYKKSSKLFSLLAKKKIEEIHFADITDHELEKNIDKKAKKYSLEYVIYETPMFVTPVEWLEKTLDNKKRYFMHSFYIKQRKRMKILLQKNGKPVGGKWSFDEENRQTPDENIKLPNLYKPRTNKFVKEAQKYVEKNFKNNPGQSQEFFYPVTFKNAQKWLQDFLKKRLKQFGPYQDAMLEGEHFLFHSVLTPVLNIGLLTPQYVLDKTIAHAKRHKIPINSIEGFIRQIIGWREFVRGVYLLAEKKQKKSNFFGHRKKMPQSFWDATTGIDPVDLIIQKINATAYAHHIERLMVLGNIMLLERISPHEIYKWFMELFIDSYDWVMVPNVYGMSQYADGGLMTTKPYISSSNYILKMSNYQKNEWNKKWDKLFWQFIDKNKTKIKKIPRMKIMLTYLKKRKTKR